MCTDYVSMFMSNLFSTTFMYKILYIDGKWQEKYVSTNYSKIINIELTSVILIALSSQHIYTVTFLHLLERFALQRYTLRHRNNSLLPTLRLYSLKIQTAVAQVLLSSPVHWIALPLITSDRVTWHAGSNRNSYLSSSFPFHHRNACYHRNCLHSNIIYITTISTFTSIFVSY